ncbi:MAG: hypothetical protein HC869_03285 [Rhodospirillales bacterium]|nr:hypothetical protein [Rhodospirillales bacterium]
MLSKLAVRMSEPIPVGTLEVGWPQDDNTAIPAGYTYLAQLVAHDLVQNVGALPPVSEFTGQLQRDYRIQRMVLDTIYGSGPSGGAVHFEPSRSGFGRELTLRLGHVRNEEGHPAQEPPPLLTGQPARDIARGRCPFREHAGAGELGPIARNGAPDAMIADLRNDDHVIIAQMTALFHEAHNIILRKLMSRHGSTAQSVKHRVFLEARKVLSFVYRRIVVLDLLKKLLDQHVYEEYRDAKREPIDPDTLTDTQVPVEFSHAAYRFGHVMARFNYLLNTELEVDLRGDKPALQHLMDRSSSRRSDLVPLARNWLVDWSHFFDLGDGRRLNFSRRITPYAGKGFFTDTTSVGSEAGGLKGGLYFLDLLRGHQAGVATVDSLIGNLTPEQRNRSPLLSEPSLRQNEIGKWLTEKPSDFTPDELVSLSTNPPLLFFVLFEAAHQHQGIRLGTLGSTILAEVFLISMRLNEDAIERDPAMPDLLRAVFGASFPTDAPFPADMPGLIKFMKAEGGLKPVIKSPRT